MGKLGVFSYPEIPLDEAISIVDTITTHLEGRLSRRALAQALGQRESSGWLSHKLAALRDFGLVEGRGELRLTALAERLAFSTNEEEAARAKGEAYASVALFRELEERFRGAVPDSSALTTALEELTEAPQAQVVRKAGLIRSHLASAAEVRRGTAPAEGSSTSKGASPSQGQGGLLGRPQTLEIAVGQVRLTAPLTRETLDIAIRMLEGLRWP